MRGSLGKDVASIEEFSCEGSTLVHNPTNLRIKATGESDDIVFQVTLGNLLWQDDYDDASIWKIAVGKI